jgi:predicted acetyltransferase
MTFRLASPVDADIIAAMNSQLIRDEGHRNPMSLFELRDRMASWLRGEYEAIIFEQEGTAIGYALFRRAPEFVYLRQFFVVPAHRRHGVGREALSWLWSNGWSSAQRLRVDVLVDNAVGREFWRKVGFAEYCVTMEAARDSSG